MPTALAKQCRGERVTSRVLAGGIPAPLAGGWGRIQEILAPVLAVCSLNDSLGARHFNVTSPCIQFLLLYSYNFHIFTSLAW